MALAEEGELVQSSLKGHISSYLAGPQGDYSVVSTLLSKKSMARTIARYPAIIWLLISCTCYSDFILSNESSICYGTVQQG